MYEKGYERLRKERCQRVPHLATHVMRKVSMERDLALDHS